MGRVLFIIIQLTWGILQSLAGLAVLAAYAGRPHRMHHGAVVTLWPSRFSLSLGMFIFIGGVRAGAGAPAGAKGAPAGAKAVTDSVDDRLLVHEYGHSVQSLALGPLYLPVIGLPSLVWARSRRLAQRRRAAGHSYYDFFTERWANAWGERALGRPSMR